MKKKLRDLVPTTLSTGRTSVAKDNKSNEDSALKLWKGSIYIGEEEGRGEVEARLLLFAFNNLDDILTVSVVIITGEMHVHVCMF